MTARASCWCGNEVLLAFCPGYLRCPSCETLVSAEISGAPAAPVTDELSRFYGRDYWFSYQEERLGHPNILARSRSDLPERCRYWMRAILKYKLPPARVLELGSAHGGFVAMLRWAGFDATGLEISPWVAEFARETFEIPMLLGPVEDQPIAPASLDVIALMDVLEHLPDPVSTMRRCLGLLKPDGILIIQTPCFPEGSTYEEMVARADRPLEIFQPQEHLYLFSRRSIRDLFSRLGAACIGFEPALFARYDMFPVVSRVPLVPHAEADIERALDAPAARMVRALLDLGVELDDLKQRHVAAEHDRAVRLRVIEEQGRRLAEVDADRAARLRVIEAQGRHLGEVEGERDLLRAEASAQRQTLQALEADRAARLSVIEAQGQRLGEVEGERNVLRAEVGALRAALEPLEADRAARLSVIEAQGRRLGEVEAERNLLRAQASAQGVALEAAEADRAARLVVIEEQGERLGEVEGERNVLRAQLGVLGEVLQALEADRAARLRMIEAQGRQLEVVEASRKDVHAEVLAQMEQIQVLMVQLRAMQRSWQILQGARVYRLLRRLGRWKFVEQALDHSPGGASA